MGIRVHLLGDDKLNLCCQLLLYNNYYYLVYGIVNFFVIIFIVRNLTEAFPLCSNKII